MRTLFAILAGLIGGLIGAVTVSDLIASVDQTIEGSFEGGYAWFGLMLGVPIGGVGGFVLCFWLLGKLAVLRAAPYVSVAFYFGRRTKEPGPPSGRMSAMGL